MGVVRVIGASTGGEVTWPREETTTILCDVLALWLLCINQAQETGLKYKGLHLVFFSAQKLRERRVRLDNGVLCGHGGGVQLDNGVLYRPVGEIRLDNGVFH